MTVQIRLPRKVDAINADWIPARTLEWREDEAGLVFLLKEKSRSRWMKWLIRKAGKSQFFRIHLDRFGTAAWKLADGSRSIKEIATAMQAQFGEELADADVRLVRFFTMLAGSRFVVFARAGMDANVG